MNDWLMNRKSCKGMASYFLLLDSKNCIMLSEWLGDKFSLLIVLKSFNLIGIPPNLVIQI